jgi:hypothetical protein
VEQKKTRKRRKQKKPLTLAVFGRRSDRVLLIERIREPRIDWQVAEKAQCCMLLKKISSGEAIERNEAYESFSAAC